jgi:MoxR-like ATPase
MTNAVMPFVDRVDKNIESVVLGKHDVVKMVMVALLAGEHILLEDVPGVGKTLIAKALAKSVQGDFSRIQFTPDLLPSDILGSSIYNSKTGEFVFSRGPVFGNIVLADEVNRAPPRTQSALLECMSERQVSVDGNAHQVPNPFLVIATQNPFEFEGTYLLPESQLDRFLLRIEIGYPDRDFERNILLSHNIGEPVDKLESVVNLEEVKASQMQIRNVKFEESVLDYLQDIVEATRESSELQVGVSTRGALGYYRAAQAMAAIHDRDYVVPDDIKQLAVPLIAHRVVPRGLAAGTDRKAAESIVRRLLDTVKIPI